MCLFHYISSITNDLTNKNQLPKGGVFDERFC